MKKRPSLEPCSAQPIIFPGTGSSGWEAALTNLLSKGDKVLSARFGHFSHLWIEMCKKLHIEVEEVDSAQPTLQRKIDIVLCQSEVLDSTEV